VGQLVVKSSTITGGSSGSSALYGERYAAAIALIEQNDALLMDSWITRNSAPLATGRDAMTAAGVLLAAGHDQGVGLYHVPKARVYDSHFVGNGGSQGGGLVSNNGGRLMVMDNVEFVGNSGRAAAVSYGSGYCGHISNSVFRDNVVNNSGAAPVTGGCLYLHNSTFENNRGGRQLVPSRPSVDRLRVLDIARSQ